METKFGRRRSLVSSPHYSPVEQDTIVDAGRSACNGSRISRHIVPVSININIQAEVSEKRATVDTSVVR